MACRTFLVVFGFVVVLACSSLVFAQDYWQLNKFTADNEKFSMRSPRIPSNGTTTWMIM